MLAPHVHHLRISSDVAQHYHEVFIIMAAGRAAAAGTQLAKKSVHLSIKPRPANLSESREVLKVVESFGEVVFFKNLRVSGNRAPLLNVSRLLCKRTQ